jgi:putative radical SAM enzyme (TIGR03279 family)
MVIITGVTPHSRAERHGIRAGDVLISINGRAVSDVLDYRFFLTATEVRLSLTRGGEPLEVVIRKKEYDDIGLDFETPLMDKKHSCENKCIFCFIDQLPKGMRETLYFKDDDSRLSFLHGNFITMTNLRDSDIDRIIEMHISPVNVSVHTTNPELRVKMMHNKRAGLVLDYLPRLAEAGITLCGQIVLCRGINDGAELDRSMRDLFALGDAMESVSIVPAGLTKHRDKLYPLTSYTPEEAAAVIRQVEAFAEECLAACGSRRFFCADELYLRAGLPLPSEDYYEGYAQIENGVGMITSLTTEFEEEMNFFEEYLPDYRAPRTVSVCTGVAAYPTIKALAARLEAQVEGLTIHVYQIVNHFFGESVTVAGLLTGKDMYEQLADKPLGDQLIIPENTLRADEAMFLDNMTPDELSEKLNVPIRPGKNNGAEFIKEMLGIE